VCRTVIQQAARKEKEELKGKRSREERTRQALGRKRDRECMITNLFRVGAFWGKKT
jgi:hypothetical protein